MAERPVDESIDRDASLSDDVILNVAAQVPHDKYHEFAVKLGVVRSWYEANNILATHNKDYRMAATEVLMAWKVDHGSGPAQTEELRDLMKAARLGSLAAMLPLPLAQDAISEQIRSDFEAFNIHQSSVGETTRESEGGSRTGGVESTGRQGGAVGNSSSRTEHPIQDSTEGTAKFHPNPGLSVEEQERGIKPSTAPVSSAEYDEMDAARSGTEESVSESTITFYDIFLMPSGEDKYLKKFNEITERNGWEVHVSGKSDSLGNLTLQYIEEILETSSHLVILIDKGGSRQYKAPSEQSMTLEMAFQLAVSKKTLKGKIIPIRCCERDLLPLRLRAFNGAHIDDRDLEDSLRLTIDTSVRKKREERQKRATNK